MLNRKGPAPKRCGSQMWICESCGERQGMEETECRSCKRPPTHVIQELPRRHCAKEPAQADPIEAISDESESEGSNGEVMCLFAVSKNTGRVHVLDAKTQQPLGANFKLVDWETLRAGSKLPAPLEFPGVMKETVAFVADWLSLTSTEQRVLTEQPMRPPLRAYMRLHRPSIVRHSKAKKPRLTAAGDATSDAAVDDNGWATEPGEVDDNLCGWCQAPIPDGASNQRFCSSSCQEKLAVTHASGAARMQVFAEERGVCRLCALDAHALFERVKGMEPPERYQEYLRVGIKARQVQAKLTRKAQPNTKATKAMLQNPSEGMLWQADHIVPVAEGGGECDLSNLRTLCTTCHAQETKRLRGRLRQPKDVSSSSADIRSCFAGTTARSEDDVILL